jgi:hypothetical protein
MKAATKYPGLVVLALTIAAANAGAQSDQDHGAHHPGSTPVQTTPMTPPSAAPDMDPPRPGNPSGGAGQPMQTVPNGMGGMMGGNASRMMRGDAQATTGGDMKMMQMMQMMQAGMAAEGMGGPMGMMDLDHIEGRLAFLRTELGIADAQQPQWTQFADAVRAQAGVLQAMRLKLRQDGRPERLPERLALVQQVLSNRLEAVKAIQGPALSLYAVLSPEQQQKADDLMGHRMGGM